VCSSIDRLAITSSITAGMKKEQLIRVRTDFRVKRGRTGVEEKNGMRSFDLFRLDWLPSIDHDTLYI
jgi:hypothetical protein